MSTLTSVTNLYSLNIFGSLSKAQNNMNTAIRRLSSGEAVSNAFDNPAGFSISERMRDYIQGLKRASLNAQDGISYLQTAEGAATEINSMLQRMRELAVESSNGIYTSNDRQELQNEMDQLKAEIDRIAQSTEYNTQKLLNGESAGAWNSASARISAVITGSVADGNYDISLNVEPGKNQVMTSQILTIKNGKLGAQLSSSGSSNIAIASAPDNIRTTNGNNYQITVSDRITSGDTADLASSYIQKGGSFATGPIGTAITTNESGYLQIEFTQDSDTANLAGTAFRARFISAETGEEGAWMDFTSGINDSLSGTYTMNGVSVSFQIPITTSASSTVSNGDKLLFNVSDNKDMAAADQLLVSGGGTLQISQGGKTGPFITYDGKNSLTKADNKDGVQDINNVTVYMAEMDTATGEFKKGSITLGFKENSSAGATLSGTATIEVRGGGEAATDTTKLSDIANFTDSNGVDLLYSTQELNLFGNSRTASVYIDKSDTVSGLMKKLASAITSGLDLGSGDVSVDKRIAEYSASAETGFKSVPGTIALQSAVTGHAGKISFIGNQKLMDALGFQTVQEASDNITKVTVKNIRTGEAKETRATGEGRAKDVVEGLDIAFDPRASVAAAWNEKTGRIEFEKSYRLENYNLNLHVVDDRTKVQIGVMKGENIDVSIPQIDTVALGIDKTVLTTQEESQKAITQIEGALKKVTSVRAQIGAHVNRLDSALNSLQTTATNVTTADSRIRDADIAAETSNMAMAQLLYQTDIAMLAQANQIPGMALSLLTQR